MSVEQNGVSRRTLIKGAALGGIGIAGGATVLSSCGSKPTICECHEAFLENTESAMSGDASVSDEVAECSKHYSTEEMVYADENNGY